MTSTNSRCTDSPVVSPMRQSLSRLICGVTWQSAHRLASGVTWQSVHTHLWCHLAVGAKTHLWCHLVVSARTHLRYPLAVGAQTHLWCHLADSCMAHSTLVLSSDIFQGTSVASLPCDCLLGDTSGKSTLRLSAR